MHSSESQQTRTRVVCPYCGELLEIFIEPDVEGELIQDCEVCCHPWRLRVERRGGLAVRVDRLDD